MNLFFDTSALVKIFHDEEGSSKVIELVLNEENCLFLLDIAKIEFYSALYRRLRNGELSRDNLERAKEGFEHEISHFNIQPTTPILIEEAKALLVDYGEKHGLRTLDSLHLAAFTLISDVDWIFVCCDLVLSDIIEIAGYHVINPMK